MGTQLESEFGGDRCFGVLANMDFILVCTYEKYGIMSYAAEPGTSALGLWEAEGTIRTVYNGADPRALWGIRLGDSRDSIEAKVENGQFILTRFGWDEDPAKGESLIVSAKDTRRLMDSLNVKHPETLLKALGRRFALKEPHNSFVKILTSLQRRGIPFERK